MAADTDTELGRLIDRQIAETGPMPLALFMQLCLTHPRHGYYFRPTPIGRAGDFVTAPEISQVFGETIGVFVALVAAHFPDQRFELVELGPGRGTLMSDLWRSLARLAPQAQIGGPLLVEIGADLKAEQARVLSHLAPRWLERVGDIPLNGPPLVVIANEFFDALPVRQYQKTESGWHERVVGLDADGRRVLGLNPTPIAETALPDAVREAELHARFEQRPAADAVMSELAERLTRRGGVLLAIDYGYAQTRAGDTVQAIEGHAAADPLAHPGRADLTAHVDFAALGAAAHGLERLGVLTQAELLAALGAPERFTALARANPDRADALAADLDRLTGPDGMGTLFKGFCACSPGIKPYPFIQLHDGDPRASIRQEGGRTEAPSLVDEDKRQARDRSDSGPVGGGLK